jgi:pimeloyl-ACP methyl ester carboxylesterase
MPFIKYKQKSIFYQLKKNESEDALIFVHGSGGDAETWKYQFNLKINCDIVALDLPSHRNSDHVPELSLDLYVDIIKELIDQLSYRRVILAGHSLGGAIVQETYFKHPEKVDSLILIGTGARLKVSPIILAQLRNDYEDFIASLPIGAFYRKTSKDIIEWYARQTSKVGAQVTLRDFMICDAFNRIGELSSIKIPCLIICGKADKLTPVKYSQFFNDNIKDSELVVINEAGHMVMLEKPEDLNQAIKNFIIKR